MISQKLLALLRTFFIGNPEELETNNKVYLVNSINELNRYSKILDIGIVNQPTIVRNTDGTIVISNDGEFVFNTTNDLTGNRIKLTLPQQTLSVNDNSLAYLYAEYENGNASYKLAYTNSIFGSTPTKVNVCRVVREGSKIHFTEYGQTGIFQSEQHLIKEIKLRGAERQDGIILSVNRLKPIVSSGSVYFGIKKYEMPTLNVEDLGTLMYRYSLSNGNWIKSGDLQELDNLYYSNGTNDLTLDNNKYVAKYIFIDVGDDKEVYYISGNQYNTIQGAINEIRPTAPSIMTAHSLYVGKIVLQKSATTSTAYPRTWGESIINTLE